MHHLPILKPGDSVEIIAPASRCSDTQLASLRALLESWQLNCLVADDIFGKDLLCANTDDARFEHLLNAIQNPKTKAIICARGGYGSMRLIPALARVSQPLDTKIFVGMSDTTALQLYFQQHWQWPTIHGALLPDKFSKESIDSVKSIFFGEVKQVEFTQLIPLNTLATEKAVIHASVTGGNLCLVQAGIGTTWQMDGRDKIILLEEVDERGYQVDRMLEHLRQAALFSGAKALIFGDFLGGEEPDGSSLINPVLQRFAKACDIPVVQIKGIGHGYTNFPIPLGTGARLQLGHELKLSCNTTY